MNETVRSILETLEIYGELYGRSSHVSAIEKQVLQQGKRVLERNNMAGHLTSSLLIIDPDIQKCLLIFHKSGKKWLQPGGHYEGGTLLESALREAQEETGIDGLKALGTVPVSIDTHSIMARPEKKEGEHVHHDFLYAAIASVKSRLLAQEDEVADIAWKPFDKTCAGHGHLSTGLRRALKLI